MSHERRRPYTLIQQAWGGARVYVSQEHVGYDMPLQACHPPCKCPLVAMEWVACFLVGSPTELECMLIEAKQGAAE
jgi:hypothetical protein